MTRSSLQRLEALSRSFAVTAEPERAPDAALRTAEALIFAAKEPVTLAELARRLPAGSDPAAIVAELARTYAGRGINLVPVAGGWTFRTASDLAYALAPDSGSPAKLSRAATEVLAIIAYHQPATRAEIEEIRGVTTSKGTLDILIEAGWVRLRGRRRAPGRPVTYGTTPAFLSHFGLDAITDLPGLDDLKGMGFLQGRLSDRTFSAPYDGSALGPDEEPLDPDLLSVTPFEPEGEEA